MARHMPIKVLGGGNTAKNSEKVWALSTCSKEGGRENTEADKLIYNILRRNINLGKCLRVAVGRRGHS